MPQYFLEKANVKLTDFKGRRPGFSGSHDATIALVESGSYEAGVLNEQVWNEHVGKTAKSNIKAISIWRSPTYADYHWLAQPNLDTKFGVGFTQKLKDSLLSLSNKSNSQRKILSEGITIILFKHKVVC